MKHECGNCIWMKKGDGTGMVVKGNRIFINSGDSMRCTAKVIAKIDLRGEEMFCSSFKPKEVS